MPRRPFVSGTAHGYTCAGCHKHCTEAPLNVQGVGLVCRVCFAFLALAARSEQEATA